MEYSDLWWAYSKPASVEDKEQSSVPLTAPLFAGFHWQSCSFQMSALASQYCMFFQH
jgi:hypothetical protein